MSDLIPAQVPETGDMEELLNRVRTYLDAGQIWVNPDCGLKTRGNAEVWPSLEHMVQAAKALRERPPIPAS